MSKKLIAIASVLLTACLIFINGCYKVTTYTVPTDNEVTTPVSFATDLVPIFSRSCAVSGCHNSGGLKPDLSATKAYTSIINGSYEDLTAPQSSVIYLWLTGKKAVTMPVGAANNPSNINQLILAWIKQGAHNN